MAIRPSKWKSVITCWSKLAPTVFPWLKDSLSWELKTWLKSAIQSQFGWERLFRVLSYCQTRSLLAWLGCLYTKVIKRGLPLLSSKIIWIRCSDANSTVRLCLGIHARIKPPRKPTLGISYPSEKPHLTQNCFPLSLTNLVSIRNKMSGLNAWAFFWHFRTTKDLPRLLQFQLIILIAFGENA